MADDIYRERAHLVAFLATLFPSVSAYADPAEPDWLVVYIDAPTGQLSWHISPADRDLFGHVPRVPANHPRVQWDQHTTAEKYMRLARMIPLTQRGGPADGPVAFEERAVRRGRRNGLNLEAMPEAPPPLPTALDPVCKCPRGCDCHHKATS